jgi:hypothetical protein
MRHDFLLTEGRQGRSRTKRGEETHQRRGQNGISGSERRQEMAIPRLFPPGSHFTAVFFSGVTSPGHVQRRHG